MPASDYLAGLLFFLPTLAAGLGGAWLILLRRYPELRGSARAVAFGVLAVLAALTVHLVPGALGVLSRETVLVMAVLFLVAASLVPAVSGEPSPPPEPSTEASTLGRALAAASVGLAGLFALAAARDQLFLAPGAVDTLNFHLPTVLTWVDSGSIWDIGNYLPDVAPGHYPNNGDVLLLAALLPWSNDFLSHLALYPVWLLTGIATYALARELSATREAAAVAAALLLAIPSVIVPALIGSYPDALALFGVGAGVLFLIRHARTGLLSELVLAGLALGVAFGTKWYGVSVVAVVIGVWAVGGLTAGRRVGTVARQGLILLSAVALAGGIWMLRNWIESGNPVFPVRVAPFGIEIFDAPRDVVRERAGFTIADYLDEPSVWWDHILPQYRDALALPAVLLLAGAAAAAVLALRRAGRRAPGRRLVLLGLLAAGAMIAVYAITPYSAGGPEGNPTLVGPDSRYVVPALLIAAALSAWAASTARGGITVLAALSLVAIAHAIVQVSDSTLSGASIDRRDWLAALGLTAAVAVAVFLAGRASGAWARAGETRRRIALAIGAALALVAVAIGGHEAQKRFNGVRYVGQDPAIDGILTVRSDLRVGLAGTWDNGIPPVLPAFGPGLDNEVAYVGRDRGFVREYRDRREFLAAVQEGDYQYLLVGNGIPPRPEPRAVRWALGAGFETAAESERLTLLRAPPGPLDAGSGGLAGDREHVVAEEQPERP